MKVQVKCDINLACKVILEEHLESMGIPYRITGIGEIQFDEHVPAEQFEKFASSIKKYGLEIIDDPKNAMVQKIKDVIIDMVYKNDKLPESKISAYLAQRMNLSYGYLSKIFSEVTYTSIENFVIIQKIELAKQLMINTPLNLTEISIQLNYSSVAHLSSQFKNMTGMTPSAFQRIISKRRELSNKNNS